MPAIDEKLWDFILAIHDHLNYLQITYKGLAWSKTKTSKKIFDSHAENEEYYDAFFPITNQLVVDRFETKTISTESVRF